GNLTSTGAVGTGDNGFITLSANGSGNISQQSGSNTLSVDTNAVGVNSDLNLTSGTGNITLSNVLNSFQFTFANTGGNVSLSATASLTFGASSAGAGATFSVLSTVPTSTISLAGNISAPIGTIGTINITDSASPSLIQGTGILIATNVNLSAQT